MGRDSCNNYDSEPVRFCSKCYSLKVKYDEIADSEYCTECGCSDISETSIGNWEVLYEKRYGRKYVEKTVDPKKTYVFRMPIDKLKSRLYKSTQLKEIIHVLYPHFPGGLDKADSIILLFDKLIKDNRLDELRLLVWKNNF